MTRTITAQLACAGLIACAAVAGAQAQTPGAEPAHGNVDVSSGFADDPRSVGVRGGGAISADRLDSSCRGYINDAPTIAVNYADAGDFDLYISAASDIDTTLAVVAPDGSVHCDDDGGEGAFNPGVRIDDPASGRYDVWLGTYSAGVGYPPGMIHVSELGFFDTNDFARSLDPAAVAAHSMSLEAGFADDPRSVEVTSGGEVSLSSQPGSCRGWAGEAPDLRLSYEADGFPLFFSTESETDGTLVVMTPSGEYLCDDDSASGFNPGVRIQEPESGEYVVWAGTYSDVGERPATLHVSEIGFAGVDNSLDVTAASVSGDVALASGFTPDPHTMDVRGGGAIQAGQATDGQVVAEGYCTGYVSRAPTAELTFEAGEMPLFISATTDGDGTLLVNAPDGAWWCNDDQQGLNPGLRFDDPQSGVYDIYLGNLRGEEELPGQLHISELGYGAEGEGGGPVDIGLPALFGDHDIEGGFLPDPYQIEVEAGGPLDADDAVPGEDYCRGHVTEAPTAEIRYDGASELHIYVRSERDTTLAVNLPDGTWVCDDDGADGLNPGLSFSPDASGVYDVYVGTYSGGGASPATLYVSEIALDHGVGAEDVVDISLPAREGDHALAAGFTPDPYEVEVTAGGQVDLSDAISQAGLYCPGYGDAAPNVELDWDGEGGPLFVYTESGADTTLAINLPDGSWVCDDDGAEGLRAGLEIENAPDGIYDIYVGQFSRGTASASLLISELGMSE
ncbi:hypothetical protein DDZ18_02145 [Marinicauda salina]|uniref:Ig-like domain-containing protein n=1 Tax=Marinicauda salina TaxID=2135793 RepID=A0A2U2BWS5_9PROT|nr:hypothetical protein [Marinicauda salina]PWE18429.1 hypothetical protein DDZ18_02145 [Marinicauda salina]